MSDAIRKTKRVQHYAHKSDSFGFFNLLTRPELLVSVEAQLPAHRERLFPPTETLSMFLAQVMSADGSCRHIVNQAATQRLLGGLPLCSSSTGGYCRARERLPLPMVRDLAQQTGAYVAAQWPHGERWRGRPVRLVDGTTVTMPDTPANQAAYPQQRNQKRWSGFSDLPYRRRDLPGHRSTAGCGDQPIPGQRRPRAGAATRITGQLSAR